MSTIEALEHDGTTELDECVLSDAVDEFLEHNDAIFKTVSIFLRFQEQNGTTVTRHNQASFPIRFLHPTPDLLTDEEFFRYLQVKVLSAKRQFENTHQWNPSEESKEFLEEAEKTYALLQHPFESEAIQQFIAEQRAICKGMKADRELTKAMRCYEIAIDGHAESEVREIHATVIYIDRASPNIDRTWEFTRSC